MQPQIAELAGDVSDISVINGSLIALVVQRKSAQLERLRKEKKKKRFLACSIQVQSRCSYNFWCDKALIFIIPYILIAIYTRDWKALQPRNKSECFFEWSEGFFNIQLNYKQIIIYL